MLLFEEIQFPSKDFPFTDISRSYCMTFHQFVAWNIHRVVFLPFLFLCFAVVLFVLYVTIVVTGYWLIFLCSLWYISWILVLMQSSMLVSPHLPSFLDTYSLFLSSFKSKVLCIIIINSCFLIYLSEFLSCPFLNGPEYLIRRTAQMFVSLMIFLQYNFVLKSFLIFLNLYLFDGVCL